MAQTNADYDAANLYVDPDGLKTKADALLAQAENTAQSLENINNTLSALQLGWAGKTADEARDFGNRWEAVMKELFGSKDHPEKGVLNAIVDGLLVTRGNFSQTEDALVQLFKQFGSDLTSNDTPPPSGPPPTPDNITDLNLTAITETWS
jgi:uncharacterized protein YukE